MATVDNILAKMSQAQTNEYVLNSDFSVTWQGQHASQLNAHNEQIISIAIPERTIETIDSKTANAVTAKLGTSVSVGDMEVSWRLTKDFGVLYSIESWMKSVKAIGRVGGEAFFVSGYFSDYCLSNSCKISNAAGIELITVEGLYPIGLQNVSFSAEGGDYLKVTATFTCYLLNTMLYDAGV